jgi:hypothetical protein
VLSCRKPLENVEDYFPKVKMLSAQVQTDGSILVTGMIESEGESPVESVGFCCGTQSSPPINSKQVIAGTAKTFSAVFDMNFNYDSTYYFNAWAVNAHGYSTGVSIAMNNIIGPPVVPTCTPTMNTIKLSGSTPTHTCSDVTDPVESMGLYSFSATTLTGPIVYFTFGSVISTGIYTTTTSSVPANGEVHINFYDGFTSGTLSTGSNVYVNFISSGVWDVTVCNAPWIYSSSTFYFTSRLTVPY